MEKEKKIRSISSSFKVREEGNNLVIEGKAIVYNSPTWIGDWYIEEIDKGSATESLKSKDQDLFLQHDSSKLLASVRNGSLQLTEKDDGVYIRATLLDGDKDIYEKVKSRLYDSMSFGFYPIEIETTYNAENDTYKEKILRMEVVEVSIVAKPAYQETAIESRDADIKKRKEDYLASMSVDLDTRYKIAKVLSNK